MKKSILIIVYFITINLVSQPCIPKAASIIENKYISSGISNIGELWSNSNLSDGGFEYPRRTSTQIANGDKGKFLIFSGGIWMSSKENNIISHSEIMYSSDKSKLHFIPGPIHLKNGQSKLLECSEFDKIWKVKKSNIDIHKENFVLALSFPLTNIDIDILDWPGKGNKRFINFPIEDDLAPFEDINNNGIYDPEYGDYPKIKGDESQFVVFNDVSMGRIDTPNKAIGVEVQLMTSIFYSQVENGLGTSLFHDCRIIKKTAGNARDFILSLYQDGDLGNFSDDYLGCDTLSNTGFMYNADEYDEPAASVANYGYNPPILFTSFINKKMGAFSFFINGSGGPLNDPVKDKNFRYLMEGLSTIGTPYTIGFIPGNPITKHLYFGNPSDSTQWSMQSTAQTPRDIRMLMSSEKTMLEYNKPIDYNFVTYVHKFKGSSFKPNITDSVLQDLNKVKSKYKDSLDCNIQFNFTITPDTNNLKKGKIELSSFTNIKPPYTINWSSLETTDNIKNKDSGWYRVIIKDANHCIKVSQFKIPKIYKNSAGIDANHIESVSVYPIPFQNQISISNPERLKINKIVLFDIVGKQVKEINLYNKNTKQELQVNELPQGNYILSIRSDSDEKNFRISK